METVRSCSLRTVRLWLEHSTPVSSGISTRMSYQSMASIRLTSYRDCADKGGLSVWRETKSVSYFIFLPLWEGTGPIGRCPKEAWNGDESATWDIISIRWCKKCAFFRYMWYAEAENKPGKGLKTLWRKPTANIECAENPDLCNWKPCKTNW